MVAPTDSVPLVAWTPLFAALGATALTWLCTAFGAASVFVLPRLPARAFAALLAFAAGVMMAAAIGGLLLPAWGLFAAAGYWALGATALGVVAGAALALGTRQLTRSTDSGPRHRPQLGAQLFTVMSLHHIPEGMAVGLAVTAAASGEQNATVSAGVVLLAMASHNLVEGALVSLPLRQEGASRTHAFAMGQLSGAAEVIGAVIGVAAVTVSTQVMPWGMAIASGAMVMVTLMDILPGMQALWRAEKVGVRRAIPH